MPSLLHEYSAPDDVMFALGNHSIPHIVQTNGMGDLPDGIDGHALLSLQLPSIPIKAGGQKVADREFYLCYSPRHQLLFVVETEVSERIETTYRAQYGANDNYDARTIVSRIVWVYRNDSERAKQPDIAEHLRRHLP